MVYKDPNTLTWLSRAIDWAFTHPYAVWGSLSAFLVSLWASLRDGYGWLHSLFGAVLAIIITLSLLALMRLAGWHEEWMPIVGMIVGFIGADRIRVAVLNAWENRKHNLVNNNDHDNQP
jgi:lambda family phage holin